MKNITIDEFMKLNDANIIDIRNSQSYNNNHIFGAINIPYNEIIKNANMLDRNKKYYIYCQKGSLSQKICIYLTSLGYDVVNLIGGYEEWIMKN